VNSSRADIIFYGFVKTGPTGRVFTFRARGAWLDPNGAKRRVTSHARRIPAGPKSFFVDSQKPDRSVGFLLFVLEGRGVTRTSRGDA
jgi:hypothetical protein